MNTNEDPRFRRARGALTSSQGTPPAEELIRRLRGTTYAWLSSLERIADALGINHTQIDGEIALENLIVEKATRFRLQAHFDQLRAARAAQPDEKEP